MKERILFVLLVMGGWWLMGCQPDWNVAADRPPRYAVPLLHGSVSAADIIDTIGERQKVKTAQDGLVSLVFRASTRSKTAEEAFSLPSLPLVLAPGVSTYPVPSFSGVQIYRIDCKGGFLRIVLQQPSAGPLQVTVESPSIVKDNVPFSFSSEVASVNGMVQLDTSVSLQGYTISVPQSSPALTINHSVVDVSTHVPVIPTMFSVVFDSLKFRYMEFSLGTDYTLESFRDTVKIDLMEHIKEGNLFMRDPSLILEVVNEMGAPVKLGFSNVTAYAAATGQSITFLSPLPSLFVNMDPAPGRGDTTYFRYRIDTTNSNLRDVLSLLASEIRYQSLVTMLPTGGTGFVEDTSKVTVTASLHIPLYGYANVTMEKEFEASFTEDMGSMDSLVLYLQLKSDFPLSAEGQLYMVDSQGVVFDSLFAQSGPSLVISPATVALDGTVLQQGVTFMKIAIGRQRAQRLKRLAKLRAVMMLGLHNAASPVAEMKIFDSYRMAIQLSAEITPDL